MSKENRSIVQIEEILFRENVRMGLTIEQARESAADAIRIMRETFAGERVYFPGTAQLSQAERNEKLYAAVTFGGIPVSVAARRMSISLSTAKRALLKMRLSFNAMAIGQNLQKCA